MTKEIVRYNSYHQPPTRKSKFIKGATVVVEGNGTMTCPRCSESQKGLDHGEKRSCAKCGLSMQLYGDGLHLWEARLTP